jgi:L-ascorbate metabolism protein UlaG (beta-lactamase superfamily)
MIHTYTDNPKLKYIDLPFEWKGTPLDKNGRFINHEHFHNHSFKMFLKWQTTKNEHKTLKKTSTWKYDITKEDFINQKKDCIVWLGHASFYIQLNGIKILIDPILYDISLLKRNTELPCHPTDLKNIDYTLISHDHRDHLDEKSLKTIIKQNPNTHFLTGLNNDKIIESFTNSKKIQAAGWYQQYELENELTITYLPTRHWCRRLIRDTNYRLWGGFLIQHKNKTIYFGGDSGYGSHFSDLHKIAPKIDYALLGIGAYKPEFFMGQSHMSPADAVKAFEDTQAKYMIPMHHSTFDLSDEALSDPIHTLQKIEKEKQLTDKIKYPKIGERLII